MNTHSRLPSSHDLASYNTHSCYYLKDFKPDVTYVIVCYEEAYWSGLVKELTENKVIVSCMQRSGLNSWKWPKPEDLHPYSPQNIIKIIDTPDVLSSRGTFSVPEVEEYWKIPKII